MRCVIRIGEKLNSSIPKTRDAIARRDEAYVAALAKAQLEAGADMLDVNAAAAPGGERDALVWLVRTVQRETGARLMIDSTDAAAVEAALEADAAGSAVVNSVTLEEPRLSATLSLAARRGAGVVALPISPAGIPREPAARLQNADLLMQRLSQAGIPPGRIYIDPLVGALAADSAAAAAALETIRLVRAAHPLSHILCGVSNASFGLPRRKLINAAFLTGALLAGADAAIFDVADPAMREAAAAAEALAGRDEYCAEYIAFCRKTAALDGGSGAG